LERQAWLMARSLARQAPWEACLAVRHTVPIRPQNRDGVRIVSSWDRLWRIREAVSDCLEVRPRFPWLQLKRWNWRLLWQVPVLAACRPFKPADPGPLVPDRMLSGVGADVYCCLGVSAASANVVVTAHERGAKAVLFLVYDADLDPRFASTEDFVSEYGERAEFCRFVLREADLIVAQTQWQQQKVFERFGREAALFRNPLELSSWTAESADRGPPLSDVFPRRFALWIGRADRHHKRPLVCLELARLCPEVTFLMVVNPREREVWDELHRTAPPNVRIVGHVRPEQMPAVMRRAAVLVSTAIQEGFPNVFLEAAAAGVPVASQHVGREFFEAAGCDGWGRGDLDRLAAYVRQLWADPERRNAEGMRGYAHVSSRYAMEHRGAELSTLLARVTPHD
jgi:glycosyltransferase involved in cell wall biosynthesis